MGLLYSNKYFSEELRLTIVELIEDIRNAFTDILHEIPWMDKKTRETAIKKAKSITPQIGYPIELIENNSLDKYYEHLEMEPDNFLLNTLRLEVFNNDNTFKDLREPVVKPNWKTLLDLDPTDINAFYDCYENSMRMN